VYEPIKLAARVLDVAGGPVRGITVSFGIWGSCRIEPRETLRAAVSDARGYAFITFRSLGDGKIAVVAAALNDAMTMVNSEPARLTIVDDDDRYDRYGETEQGDRRVHGLVAGKEQA
jgi:hypothetical protein